MLPNFLGVGAQKSGTTTLFHLLVAHPDIYMPRRKEARFFCNTKKFKKGISWYEKTYFSGWKGERAVGEISPSYMVFEEVPERIYRTLGPRIKLLFILRNPIERAYSHYWRSVRNCREQESFERAIEFEKERLESLGDYALKHFSYVTRDFYDVQIKRFLKYFPMKSMFIALFDDLVNDPEVLIRDIYRFLGVDPSFEHPHPKIIMNRDSVPRVWFLRRIMTNKKLRRFLFPFKGLRAWAKRVERKWNLRPIELPPVDGPVKERLLEIFRPHIEELERLIGRDLSHWMG